MQGSAKIVALNLEDPYRSARPLQKCADFLKIGHRLIYLFHSNFADRLLNFERLLCHIDFVWADTFSHVAPFWLVDVLIKCCCYNISATQFVAVFLVIAVKLVSCQHDGNIIY